mgnify:CR=1 FL=1
MSDSKSIKNMSIAIDKEFKDKIELAAKQTGKSYSSLARHIIEKYMDLEVNEGEYANYIIKVPSGLKHKEKEAELRAWLQVRVEAIVESLIKK